METPKLNFKVVTAGDSGVGKTSILGRICKDLFIMEPNPTVGSLTSVKTIMYEAEDGKTYEVALHFWDTAGQEAFRALVPSYVRESDGVLFVYSADIIDSKEHIDTVWKSFADHCSAEPPFELMVCNKSDLFKDRSDPKTYYVSAKNGDSIRDLEKDLVEGLLARHFNIDRFIRTPFPASPIISLSPAPSAKKEESKCC